MTPRPLAIGQEPEPEAAADDLPPGYAPKSLAVAVVDPAARALSGRRYRDGGVKLTEPRAFRMDHALMAEIAEAALSWSCDASELVRAALAEGWPIISAKLRDLG